MNDIYFNIFFQYILCFNIFYKNYKCFLLSCRLKRFQVMNIYCQASKFYGNKRFGTAEVSWGNLRKRFIDIVRISPPPFIKGGFDFFKIDGNEWVWKFLQEKGVSRYRVAAILYWSFSGDSSWRIIGKKSCVYLSFVNKHVLQNNCELIIHAKKIMLDNFIFLIMLTSMSCK